MVLLVHFPSFFELSVRGTVLADLIDRWFGSKSNDSETSFDGRFAIAELPAAVLGSIQELQGMTHCLLSHLSLLQHCLSRPRSALLCNIVSHLLPYMGLSSQGSVSSTCSLNLPNCAPRKISLKAKGACVVGVGQSHWSKLEPYQQTGKQSLRTRGIHGLQHVFYLCFGAGSRPPC